MVLEVSVVLEEEFRAVIKKIDVSVLFVLRQFVQFLGLENVLKPFLVLLFLNLVYC